MSTTFVSKTYKKPRLIISSAMRHKDDGQIQRTKYIQFENYKYTTSDEKEIEFIRAHREFGTEYKELKSTETAPEREEMIKVSAEHPRDQKEEILSAVDAKLEKMKNEFVEVVASMMPKKQGKKKELAL